MKFLLHLIVAVLCAAVHAGAQNKPAATPAPKITTLELEYSFPLKERDAIRDLQHLDDQIEIDNQKMLVKIEQNKARQKAARDGELQVALQFAEDKHIDLSLYELDPADIRFVRKKAK